MSPPHADEPSATNASSNIISGHLTSRTPTSTWSLQAAISVLPPHSQPEPHTLSPVPFFHALTRLKTTKREGWRRFGISHGESIADHMYRMSILTMLAPRSLSSRLDIPHCTKMALVHDMAELLVGDITPVDGVLKGEKSRREGATMDYLCRDLLGMVDGGLQGEELRSIWQEYEDGVTEESKFVHDVDKMELVLQMVEYEKQEEGRIDLSEFMRVAVRIELEEVKQWCREVLRERQAYWDGLPIPTGFRPTNDSKKQTDASLTNGDQE